MSVRTVPAAPTDPLPRGLRPVVVATVATAHLLGAALALHGMRRPERQEPAVAIVATLVDVTPAAPPPEPARPLPEPPRLPPRAGTPLREPPPPPRSIEPVRPRPASPKRPEPPVIARASDATPDPSPASASAPAPRPAEPAPPEPSAPQPAPPAASMPADTVPATPPQPPAPAAVAPAAPRTVAIGAVRYLQPPVLDYPLSARRAREEGRVHVRVLVDPKGRPAQAAVVRSSGFARLDASALAAAQAARFVPHTENGAALPFWVVMPLVFELEN